MACRLAARFGGMPSRWAAEPLIYQFTMTDLARREDEQHQQQK